MHCGLWLTSIISKRIIFYLLSSFAHPETDLLSSVNFIADDCVRPLMMVVSVVLLPKYGTRKEGYTANNDVA